MGVINIPIKSVGDTYFAEEMNEIVKAIKFQQESRGGATYFDTAHDSLTPQVVTGTGWTQINNNAGVKEEGQLPILGDLPFPLYNVSGLVAPSVGCSIKGWISIEAQSNQNDSYLEVAFDIGGATERVIFIHTLAIPKGANTPHEFIIPFSGIAEDDFFTNGAKVVIKPKVGTTLEVWDAVFYVEVIRQAP